MRTKRYACDCGALIVFYAFLTHDTDIFALGMCVKCRTHVKYDIQQLIEDALEPVIGFPTGGNDEPN